MPTYEFKCVNKDCDVTVFERTMPITADRSHVPCHWCGEDAKPLISKPSVHFRGSGYHVTDYRAKNAASA